MKKITEDKKLKKRIRFMFFLASVLYCSENHHSTITDFFVMIWCSFTDNFPVTKIRIQAASM